MKFLQILEDGSAVQITQIDDDVLAEVDQETCTIFKFENGIFQELFVKSETSEPEDEEGEEEVTYTQEWKAVRDY